MDSSDNSKLLEHLFAISRFLKGEMRFERDGQHLTLLQLQALVLLMQKKELQMQDIAGHFKVTKPTATSLLNKLSLLGLTQRKGDKEDRRVVKVSLTKKGEEMFKKARKHREQKLSELLSLLNPKDRETLTRILETLSDKLKGRYEE